VNEVEDPLVPAVNELIWSSFVVLAVLLVLGLAAWLVRRSR
jgi:hypothetical protein